MLLKAVTLTQPWATLVALGYKSYETRTWGPEHRGLLAIHAAKGMGDLAKAVCRQEPFRRLLISAGFRSIDQLPLGSVLAIVNLADVFDTEAIAPTLPILERTLGDYSPGRRTWMFTDIMRLKFPVPAKGSLNMWNWEAPFDLDQIASIAQSPW